MNESTPKNETKQDWVEVKISLSVAYLAILLVAVIGNSFIIHVARKRLSINMAVSDILYALTVVPLFLIYLFKQSLWFSEEFEILMCKFLSFALVIAISSSILTLTAMTVDRYLAIVPEVKKLLTRKAVLKVIFSILVFSFGWSSIHLFKRNKVSQVYSEEKLSFCMFCSCVYSEDKDVDEKLRMADYTLSFTFFYAFPVVAISVLYVFIIRFLWLRKIPGNRTNQNETQRRKQLRKVTCMLVTMATSFAVTWFPVYVANYFATYEIELTLPEFVQIFLFWSAHTNCATNPCFYLIFIKEYRENMQRIGCCCKNRQGKNRAQEINLQ